MRTFAPNEASLEFSFRPSIALISLIRDFLVGFASDFLSEDEVSRVAIAVHELLENTLNYSTDGVTALSVDLCRDGGDGVFSVSVKNRASPTHIAELQQVLEKMRVASNARAYYRDAMLRSAKRTAGSGLGLARIWVECDMTLSGQVEGDLVSIVARGNIGKGGPRG